MTDPSGYYCFDERLDVRGRLRRYTSRLLANNCSRQSSWRNEVRTGADAGDVVTNDNGEDTPVNGGISSGVGRLAAIARSRQAGRRRRYYGLRALNTLAQRMTTTSTDSVDFTRSVSVTSGSRA